MTDKAEREVQLHPQSPKELTAVGVDGAIELDWGKPAVEPGYTYAYNVYRSEHTTVPFEPLVRTIQR